jgi:hypothetical protein
VNAQIGVWRLRRSDRLIFRPKGEGTTHSRDYKGDGCTWRLSV